MRSIHLLGIEAMAFICGCGHTGTTLLATILSAHPQVYLPLEETHVFRSDRWTVRTRGLRRLRREALAAGRRYIIEKTPRHIHKLAVIRAYVPGVRFVIMVRDGRDVTASIGRRQGGDFQAGFDRWVSETALTLPERDRADVFVMRYEDLVADPRGTIRDVCAFLDLPFLENLLEYHTKPRLWFGQQSVERGTGVGLTEHHRLRNWQVNQPIFDGRGRWVGELPEEYVRRFETGRAREIMDAFGYATGQSTS